MNNYQIQVLFDDSPFLTSVVIDDPEQAQVAFEILVTKFPASEGYTVDYI